MPDSQILYLTIATVIVVLLSGLCSGLNVSIFAIDVVRLRLNVEDPDVPDGKKRRARWLLALLRNHHWTLVTLLVTNTLCMILLSILLDKLLPNPFVTLLVSVTVLLFLGEVMPQAVFMRHRVAICGFFAPLIWFFAI